MTCYRGVLQHQNFYLMTIWCYNPDPNPVPVPVPVPDSVPDPVPDPGPQERKKFLVQFIV